MVQDQDRGIPEAGYPQPQRAENSPLQRGLTVEEAFVALTRSCVRQWQGNVAGASHAEADQAVECPDLLHPADYAFSQSVGARIRHEGHPGLLIQSVRQPAGDNVAIFNPAVLSNPRLGCQLTYRLAGDRIVVEKSPGTAWFHFPVPTAAPLVPPLP